MSLVSRRLRGAGCALLGLSLLLAGAGCTTAPVTVRRDRFNFNEAGAESTKEQMLLNVVRLRYGEPIYFVEIGSMLSHYTLYAGGHYGDSVTDQQILGPRLRAVYGIRGEHPQTIWDWGADLNYADSPTITYTPVTGEDQAVSTYYTGMYSSMLYSGMYGFGRYNMSSLSLSAYRSTIDSPLTPSSGTLYLASVKYAGTFLGGEVHMVKPRFEFTHYQPITRGQSVGVHVQYTFAKSLRGSEIPFWERFYMGGERDIRGYEIYTIGQRDPSGYNMGGVKSFVFNAEYILHVGGQDSPLYLIAFHDRGNAYGADQKVRLSDMYTSTGLEARIFVPALRVPFRLIFSYNNRRIYEGDSNFAFRFAIGTTF